VEVAPCFGDGRHKWTGGLSVGTDKKVAVLGAGMHPWGKWGRNFVEYGLAAAGDALKEAGVDWTDIQYVAGADTIRNGYPGFVAGATFAQALGWTGARVSSAYAACASGAQAINNARAQILAGLCDVALVVGADTTPKGFFKPVGGDRKDDPDWLRFHLMGATNPAYFALYARRRMELFGATEADFAAVKVKNARHGLENPYARYKKEVTAEEVLASPMVADPLRLLEICATSDGGAALVLCSMEFAKKHAGAKDLVTIDAVSTVTPRFPQTIIEMPNFSTDSSAAASTVGPTFKESVAVAAYEEAGIGPEDVSLAEVYDLSSALELDWYEDIGLCKQGEAEKLLRDGDTTLGGRVPVNASGGLSCFGEAIPAQAIAQVCELVWQLRGQATGRQVEGATVGITANQGLFGHGSSVIVTK
jgi:acetyl-CoA acetyltransferase